VKAADVNLCHSCSLARGADTCRFDPIVDANESQLLLLLLLLLPDPLLLLLLLLQVLQLRQEKAALLGFKNFAELSMASKVRCLPVMASHDGIT
jgi:hypothetical protein